MKKYYPLKKIFHMNGDANAEYNNRLTSAATFVTELKINPFLKGTRQEDSYPLFIFNSLELSTALEKIFVNSNKIITLLNSLPAAAKEKFFNLLLINELQSTNEIESVNSSKKEISEALSLSKKNSAPHIKRFLGLVKLYSLLKKYDELHKVSDFRKIYDILLSEEITNESILDGKLFRKESVKIYSGNEIIHHGIQTEKEIISSLENLISFLNKDNSPEIYKALIGHFYFEYIHPFYDGNGRVGRFLLANSLAKTIDEYSAITFSYSINRNKHKYYNSFSKTSHPLNKGDVTFFVKENLEILEKGQLYILDFLDVNIKKLIAAEKYLEKNISDSTLKNILYILTQSYLFSAKDDLITHTELASFLKISPKTLNKYLKENKDKIEILKKKPKIYTLSSSFMEVLFQTN